MILGNPVLCSGASAREAARYMSLCPPFERLVVFSVEDVVAQGVIGLVPPSWQERAVVASSVDALALALEGPGCAVVLDATTPGAVEAFAAARGARAVVVLAASGQAVDRRILRDADAVLLRDEVQPLSLLVAMGLGQLGVRLLSRSATTRARDGVPAAPSAEWRVLQLLANGLSDHRIAAELHVSQSAVRKLVQRTIKTSGARTRCEAVALAIAAGIVV